MGKKLAAVEKAIVAGGVPSSVRRSASLMPNSPSNWLARRISPGTASTRTARRWLYVSRLPYRPRSDRSIRTRRRREKTGAKTPRTQARGKMRGSERAASA